MHRVTACLVLCAGAITCYPLTPPAAPAPPPGDALRALEAAGGVTAVAAGGGEGAWLRALHARANAWVRVWRGDAAPRRGAAPAWLEEDARSYLLAAPSARRLLAFLDLELEDAVRAGPLYMRMNGRVRRRLRLNGAARAVVALPAADAGSGQALRVLERLWKRHHVARALVALPGGGGWTLNPAKRTRLPSVYVPPGIPTNAMDELIDAGAVHPRGQRLRTTWTSCDARSQYLVVPRGAGMRDAFGSDVRLVRDGIKSLRAIVAPHDGPDRHLWGQPRWQGCYHTVFYLLNDLADLTMNRCGYTEEFSFRELSLLEASVGWFGMTMVAPRARPLPAWSLPLRVFGADVWLALGGAALVYALAWRVVAGEVLAASAAAALRAFSSSAGPPQGRVRAAAQRLQLAAALLACAVVVVATYEGRLYTLMTQPEREPEMATMAAVAASGVPVLSISEGPVDRLLEPAPEDELRPQAAAMRAQLANRTQMLHISFPGLLNVLRNNFSYRAAFFFSQEELEMARNIYPTHFRHFYEHKNPFYTGIETFLMLRNSPWHAVLNALQLRVAQAGLLAQWRAEESRDVTAYLRHWGARAEAPPDGAAPRSFGLADVWPAFQVLGAGLAIAAALCIGEASAARRPRV